MSIVIPRALYDAFMGTLEDRVAAFSVALAVHKHTVGVPAPIEDPIVEALARTGGAFTIEEPPESGPAPEPDPNVLRRIAPLAFRRRIGAERLGTITVAAAQDMRADPPDPTLQVMLDDLTSAQVIELDSPELIGGLALLVSRGLLAEEAMELLRADAQPGEEPV